MAMPIILKVRMAYFKILNEWLSSVCLMKDLPVSLLKTIEVLERIKVCGGWKDKRTSSIE